MSRCRALHPDWNYTLWTSESVELLPLENKALYEAFAAQIPAQADIARYEVLLRYGGIYLDADTVCFKSLDPLRQAGFFAGYHNKDNPSVLSGSWWHNHYNLLENGVIGGVAGHPALSELVSMMHNDVSLATEKAWRAVGPGYLTKVMATCEKCRENVVIHPFHAFVPYHHHEVDTINNARALQTLPKVLELDSYTMNLWGSTFDQWSTLTYQEV